MAEITVKTQQKNEDGSQTPRELTFEKDVAENLKAAIEEHGEGLVYNYFFNTAVLRIQGVARTAMQKGQSDEAVTEKVAAYRLGVVTRTPGGGSSMKSLLNKVKSGAMSREDLIAMITKELDAAAESDEEDEE